jgi:hypothetical protein
MNLYPYIKGGQVMADRDQKSNAASGTAAGTAARGTASSSTGNDRTVKPEEETNPVGPDIEEIGQSPQNVTQSSAGTPAVDSESDSSKGYH